MSTLKNRRIEWVDAAKGLAILLVIAGHTVASGTFTRNIIFSFHIPLFFILSGYTFRPASNWADFFYRTKKDAVHLLVPYVLTGLLIAAAKIILRHLPLLDVLKDTCEALIWASGTGDGKHEAIGVLWFLVSLFSARTIVNAVYTIYKGDLERRAPYLIALISLLGFGIGGFDWNWLIFNLDVSMAACGFVLAGMLLRDHLDQLKKYDRILIPVCMIIWMFLMQKFGYIEMSGRWYPEFSLGILESFCGSYCAIRFIQALCYPEKLKGALCWLGTHSLILMCVHAAEDSITQLWFTLPPFAAVCARLAADILAAFVLIKVIDLLKGKTNIQ